MVRMDLRVITIDVDKQEVMTRDNVPATVDAVVYFRVVDPVAAVVKVENYLKATSLIAQTTLRSVLGQADLDELLSHRDKINHTLQEIIDRQTDPWGVKVTAVEVRDVALPESMKRAMAKQAEANGNAGPRSSMPKASFKPPKAGPGCRDDQRPAHCLATAIPATMREIANEHNTTTFLPVPIDLFAVCEENR